MIIKVPCEDFTGVSTSERLDALEKMLWRWVNEIGYEPYPDYPHSDLKEATYELLEPQE